MDERNEQERLEIVSFCELIDDYQIATINREHDEAATARVALMEAYRAALAATQASRDAFVIQALVAAGHVTQQKVDEAYSIAGRVVPATQAGWISVKDRLPHPENDVLVRCQYGSSEYWDIAALFHGEWASHVTQDSCRYRVTHWMPLPAAPESSEKEQ